MISFKSKIYVAGHKGLVGSAIVRKLRQKGYKNIIYRSRKQLDLRNQICLLYTSPSPRDAHESRMPSSA